MKRITFFFMLVLCFVFSNQAQADGTITITNTGAWKAWDQGGTYYKSANYTSGNVSTAAPGASGWYSVWCSAHDGTSPALKLVHSTDVQAYMNIANGVLAVTDYTLTIQPGYAITGFTMTFSSNDGGTTTVVSGSESASSANSSDNNTITVTGLNSMYATFEVQGPGRAAVKNFTVNYTETPDAYYAISIQHSDFSSYSHVFADGDNVKKNNPTNPISSAYYVWQAPNDGALQLRNVGNGKYIPKFTAASTNNLPTMVDDASDAESFLLKQSTNTAYSYFRNINHFALNSTTQTSSYLDGYNTTSTDMGCHNVLTHKGNTIGFTQLKKVSFVDNTDAAVNVTVNGSIESSEIYVPVDGSASISLETTKYYTISGTGLYYNEAATAITAAGTENLTVTVSDLPENPVTYTCYNLSGQELQAATTEDFTFFTPPTITGYTLEGVYDTSDAAFDEENTIITGATTLKVKYRLATNPITASTVAAPVWQIIQNSFSYKYNYTSDGYINCNNNDFPLTTPDNFLWIFIGDETNGYDIYNKAEGKYLVCGSEAPATGVVGYYAVLSETPSTKWVMLYQGGNILYDVTDELYMSRYSGKLHLWTSAQGTQTPQDALPFYQTSYPYSTIVNNKDCVGLYSADNVNTANAAVGNAEPATIDNYVTFINNLGSTVVFDETKYYRLISAYSQYYTRQGVLKAATIIDDAVKWQNESATDPNEIFKVEASGDKWKIKNINYGQYLKVPSSQSQNVTLDDTGSELTRYDYDLGQFSFGVSSSCCLHTGGHNSGAGVSGNLLTWNNGNDGASAWYLQEADISEIQMLDIEDGLTDVYMSYANNTGADIQVPKAVTVYKVQSGSTKAEVNMQEVDTKVVPAGAGVILKTENGAIIPLLPTATSETLEGNQLLAGTGAKISDGYLLAYYEDATEPMFFLMSGLTLPDNKAYLPASYVEFPSEALRMNFGGEATGIATAMDKKEPAHIFDLQGRRVNSAGKGLYIINGKKVLVK